LQQTKTAWEQGQTYLQRFSSFWRMSANNDDEGENKGRGRKVPSGFEKILKRTRRGVTHEKDEAEKSAKDEESKKDDKEAESDDDEKRESDEKEDEQKKEESKEEEQSYG